jgi:hypothetical protein
MIGSADIYSNVPSSMRMIYEAHWETGNEVNSKSGAAIMKAQRAALTKQQTHWHIEVKNGKRKFVYNPNITRSVGDIVLKDGRIIALGLQGLIQFRTYATTGTTVVTAPMGGGTTEIRRDGKVVDRTKVQKVGQGNIDILQKLNYGLNGSSNKINTVGNPFSWQGKPSHELFKGTHTKAMNFIEEGRRNALGTVNEYITTGFNDALSRRVKTSTKIVKVA